MEKPEKQRTRSPNYPAFGLPTAIEKVTALYQNQHTHGAPREVAVKSMGYSGLNGASATAISAVMKFGLLERAGEDVRVSERAMRILHPQSPDEKSQAIQDAASEPPLFRELAEKFPGKLPTDDILRNYLIRNGFAPAAVSSVILAYRETSEFAMREVGGYDSGNQNQSEPAMHIEPSLSTPNKNYAKPLINNIDEKALAHYEFEEGGYIRIIKSGGVPTGKALKMAETLINLKKQELVDAPNLMDLNNETEKE